MRLILLLPIVLLVTPAAARAADQTATLPCELPRGVAVRSAVDTLTALGWHITHADTALGLVSAQKPGAAQSRSGALVVVQIAATGRELRVLGYTVSTSTGFEFGPPPRDGLFETLLERLRQMCGTPLH